ncbi:unnamed protein product [Adineta steineri]|uniref:C2 domain-containing protein n=1 Tax=Adineta steineri TaxID=433720 RepID=A0A813UL78_9BILA|nr:unnamed protein product [Adineta steineri]
MSFGSRSSSFEDISLEAALATLDEIQGSYDVIIEFHSAEDIPKMDVIGHADPYFIANEIQGSYDVIIEFHSAEDIPKMDVIGHADPYFIASIDDQISYTSSIIPNTGTPKWEDEKWIVRNIPADAKLTVKVYDKDEDTVSDDHVGDFEIDNLIDYNPPPNGHEILGPSNHKNGYFHLSIKSMKSSDETKHLPPYTFDGPCRYFRHDSFSVGRLTMLNTDYVYSTWKIQIRRISQFFKPCDRQYWNKHYLAAQTIFGFCPVSTASQSTIKLAHKILYGRTIKNTESGQLTNADQLWKSIFSNPISKKIKPSIYSYVIDDNTWRFSETDAQFFADYASKHALLANCSKYVRYAGEFHPRPKYGWDRSDDEWELVFDNASGTYAPDASLLNNLKELLIFNFPGLDIVTYDHDDPQLKESLEELKNSAEKYLNSTTTIQKLVMNCPTSAK